MVVINRQGRAPRYSKDLRAVYVHTRESPIKWVTAIKTANGGTLTIGWQDKSRACIPFADYYVMRTWVETAKPFKGATINSGLCLPK